MVVVAGIGELEAFHPDAKAKRESRPVEATHILGLLHLTVVVPQTGKKDIFYVQFDTYYSMASQVVEEGGASAFRSSLARERVGMGGGVKDIVVAQVPTLQLGGGKEETERSVLELVGKSRRKFEGEPLHCAVEISSMGIRVDPESLARQLKERKCEERSKLPYHKALLAGELPLTIGGGIGQSRVCMLLLGKVHIGEVQASIWDEETETICEKAGVTLL